MTTVDSYREPRWNPLPAIANWFTPRRDQSTVATPGEEATSVMPRYEALAIGLGCESLSYRLSTPPDWQR